MKHIKPLHEYLTESFHMPDGTPIGVDHLHRPITGTYQPSSLDESKIGDIYIMAAEAPNFPAFKKEFVKEYGEVKGSKEEKDLNAWLKNVWDERPTNEATKEKEVYNDLISFYTHGDKIETNLSQEEVSQFKNEIWYQLSVFIQVMEQGLIHTTKGKLDKKIKSIDAKLEKGQNIISAKVIFED